MHSCIIQRDHTVVCDESLMVTNHYDSQLLKNRKARVFQFSFSFQFSRGGKITRHYPRVETHHAGKSDTTNNMYWEGILVPTTTIISLSNGVLVHPSKRVAYNDRINRIYNGI